MPKKKKRLQMQKGPNEKFVREALDGALQFGLLDQVGYDENGEALYTMPDDIEERLAMVKKTLGMNNNFSE